MNGVRELWLFKIAQILMDKYGYQLIEVRAIQGELWLSHPEKPDFGLIRLSIYKGFDLNNIKERTLKIKEAIIQLLPNVTHFWDVEIDEEGFLQEEDRERIHIVMSPDPIDNSLVEAFPEIKQAFSPVDNPEKELEALKKKIQIVRVPKKPLTLKEQFKLLPKMTFSILAIITIITLVINGFALFGYDIVSISILLGAYYKTFVLANNELWRLFTAGFVHYDIFHLVMNGIALINLGSFIEKLYGPKRLLLILLNGIFFGSFFVFVGQGNLLLVGISGGLYALLGVMVVYLYETGLIRQPMIQSQVLRMVVMNVLINFLPNISVLGHLGGLISGLLLGIFFSKKSTWGALRKNSIIAMSMISIILVVFGMSNPKTEPYYIKTDETVLKLAREFGLNNYADKLETSLIEYYKEVIE